VRPLAWSWRTEKTFSSRGIHAYPAQGGSARNWPVTPEGIGFAQKILVVIIGNGG